MPRLHLDRVPADICPDAFAAEYYRPRRPAIVTGVTRHWKPADEWDPYVLRDLLSSSERASATLMWWDLTPDVLSDYMAIPVLLAQLGRQFRVSWKEAPVRVWISAANTPTHWHHDGHALEVFNIQVRGRKQFMLVSPDTPLPSYAFARSSPLGFSWLDEARRANLDYALIELKAGEMLFMPRHWWHRVTSLDDTNINVNWVWTDLHSGSLDNPTATRDAEILRLLYAYYRALDYLPQSLRDTGSWFDRLRQYLFLFSPEGVERFGGGSDYAVARQYFQRVRTRHACRRLVQELASLARYQRPYKVFFDQSEERNGGVARRFDDYFLKRAQAATRTEAY